MGHITYYLVSFPSRVAYVTDRQTETTATSLSPIVLCNSCAMITFKKKVSPRGRRDDMLPADGSSMVAKIAADLRPSADGSAVRTSLVAGGG